VFTSVNPVVPDWLPRVADVVLMTLPPLAALPGSVHVPPAVVQYWN